MDFNKAVNTMLGKEKKFEYDKVDSLRNTLNFKKGKKNKKEKEIIDIEVVEKCPDCGTELKKQLLTDKYYCKKCLVVKTPAKKKDSKKEEKTETIFNKTKKSFGM